MSASVTAACDDEAVRNAPESGSSGAAQRNALVIGLGVVLAALIYALREVLPNANEGVTSLYSIPIAIIAVRFGTLGGVAAAFVSLGLFAEWELTNEDITVGPVGYASRGAAFLVLGFIVGRFATERRVLVARLQGLAHSDPLTGLPNRAKFEAAFLTELARARRYGHRGAVLLADLDGFKAINDTFGHGAGDRVLQNVAGMLQEQVRSTDTAARLGGDEFAALLPETPPSGAETTAQRLRQAIPGAAADIAGDRVSLTISIGYAFFGESTDESPQQLLDAADQAMYEAKAARHKRL